MGNAITITATGGWGQLARLAARWLPVLRDILCAAGA
jgi:hypothetical protein